MGLTSATAEECTFLNALHQPSFVECSTFSKRLCFINWVSFFFYWWKDIYCTFVVWRGFLKHFKGLLCIFCCWSPSACVSRLQNASPLKMLSGALRFPLGIKSFSGKTLLATGLWPVGCTGCQYYLALCFWVRRGRLELSNTLNGMDVSHLLIAWIQFNTMI